jgi:hypothetical protein
MKKMRISMVILSLTALICIILMSIFSRAIQQGEMRGDWIGVLGFVMSGSVISNVIISYRYASKSGRLAGLWAVGSFLLPYVIPVILAFLPQSSSGIEVQTNIRSAIQEPFNSLQEDDKAGTPISKLLFDSVPVPSRVFIHKSSFNKSSQWYLDQLRLFCIILPGSFKWRVITSAQEQHFLFPDILPEDVENEIYELMEAFVLNGNVNDLKGIKVCISHYDNAGEVFDLGKLKTRSVELLTALYHYRQERREKLNQWLSNKPQVILRGGLGSKAILNQDGFHLKRKQITWQDVKGIQTESLTSLFTTTHLYMLPEGRSGGFFDLRKGKYALKLIPTKQKELYAAECHFWKTIVNKKNEDPIFNKEVQSKK